MKSNARNKPLNKDQAGSCKQIQKQKVKCSVKEILVKKINPKQSSPQCASNKNSARRQEKSSPINSPKNGFGKKNSSGNVIPKDVDNIYKLLECLNKQCKDKLGETNGKESMNVTLKNLLRAELQKILQKQEGQASNICNPASKERKNSMSNIHVNAEKHEESSNKHKLEEKEKKTRHNTPSAHRIEGHKFHNKGSVPPKKGEKRNEKNRSASRELPVSGNKVVEQIQVNAGVHVQTAIPIPEEGGDITEETKIRIYDSISSEKDKLITYIKQCKKLF